MAFLSLRASVMTSFLPSHDPQPPPAESVTSGTKVHDPRFGDPFAPFRGLAGGGRTGLGVGPRQPKDARDRSLRQAPRPLTETTKTQRTQRNAQRALCRSLCPLRLCGLRSGDHFDPTMSSGLTHWSNWSPVTRPSSIAVSRRFWPFLCAVFAILAALS